MSGGVSGSWVSVEVRVLGPFGVWAGGRRVELSSARLRVMMAVLAMSAGRAVSVDRLVDRVWGEELPANARRTVQTYITRLRAALGAESITTEPAGYVLRTDPDNVDALRFLRLLDRAGDDRAAEGTLLGEALDLWRGEPFEDLDSDWLTRSEAARLEERRLAALERRIDLDLADGRASELVGELQDLVSTHALRESIWSRLLLALAQSGRPAEALEQYETIRARIADELGADPGTELRGIYSDLLDGNLQTSTSRPYGQRPALVVPRQLPADIASFTGRQQLLATLDDLLAGHTESAGPRIVAVHGTGGVGKTTLAVHWAHQVTDRFPDGQLYLNLRGFGPGNPMPPATALDTLLRGLGEPSDRIPVDIEARETQIRSLLADRRMLIILDNARDADHVRPLLPGAGASMVIVTSRSQLRGLVAREAARRIAVDQLEPTESVTLLSGTLDAQQIAYDGETLAELAERCGHLPLALALAAERVGREPEAGVADLLVELREEQERLDALDTNDESASLRAIFAWSYDALGADVAAMFRLLGVHLGSDISLPAAAALAGRPASRVRRLLDRLVDGNLVHQRQPGRYELHDLLRAYAAELAENGPANDVSVALDRLLDWYVHSAANAWGVLWPNRPSRNIGTPIESVSPLAFDGRAQALGWFESERDALIAAVQLAAHGQHQTARGLCDALWNYLYRRQALDDLDQVLWTTADSARRNGDLSGLADATLRLGIVSTRRTQDEAARDHYEQARELYERAGDRVGQGRALSNLGQLASEMGRMQEAADYCERAIEWLSEDPREHSQGLNNLAVTYLVLERHDDAYETARRAVDVGRGFALEVDEASALDTLAQVQLALGRADEAVEQLRRARRLLSAVGARWEEGAIVANLGRALSASGDIEAARTAWAEALGILDELGSPDSREFNRADLVELIASVRQGSGA